MLKPLTAIAMIATLSGATSTHCHTTISAQERTSAAVSGRWAMIADSPHGTLTMTLDLAQSGETVTGTFVDPHGTTNDVKGTFADATLKLATTGGREVTFTATLTDKGTLTGHLSTSIGDLTWTAERERSDKR
jgi:hypothetical protein